MRTYLDDFLQTVKSIPGFVSFSVVNLKDGVVLNSVSDASYTGNAELEAAFHLEILRQANKSLEISTPGSVSLKDITIETEKLTYLLSISNKAKFFAVLIYDNKVGTLGMARAIIAKGKNEIGNKLDMEL